MRTSSKLVLAAAGALALAGVAVAADRGHVMNVVLPDGSVARIHYVGDVAPQVVMAPAADLMPVAMIDTAPFAMFDRIAAQMDAQMDAMLRQASALAAAPAATGRLSQAALGQLPAGTVSYSFTSYSSGNGAACSQSVQVTSLGQNEPPKVVRQNAGDCSAVAAHAPAPVADKPAAAQPAAIPVNLEKPRPAAKPSPTI